MLEKTEQIALTLTEKEKLKDEYLIKEIDSSIASCLTTDKDKWIEAYNIRNGVRDASDFSYLWEAYGIEFPSQIRHIPVLRTIFDSLVGQFIRRPFKYNITCADEASIKHILDEHRGAILKDITQFYDNKLKAAQIKQSQGDESRELEAYIKKLEAKYASGNFQSELEILSNRMLRWSLQRFKVKSKLITMFDDYVTCGQAYYQVKVLGINKKPLAVAVNPLKVFYTKGHDTKFIRELNRVVIKDKIPVTEIWTLYGHQMKKADQESFIKEYGKYMIDSEMELIGYDFGTIEGMGEMPDMQKGLMIPMMDVSYVEWKANTKVPLLELDGDYVEGDSQTKLAKVKLRYKYRLDRYEGVRIGEDRYCAMGKSKFIVRDPDDESNCYLTVNGTCYNDRNGEPYSLPLKTKDIADKIDIMHYHAENLLAISGTKAIMINYPDMPAWMGENPTQRIMKWLGYLKQGVAITDLSQEGVGVGKMSHQGNADLSMSTAILSIYQMIDNLEATAYKVTGVPRQAIGNITQSDGKGTSELAIQSSEVVTEPMFTSFDELAEQFVTDLVNACRISYPEGITGNLVLGQEGQKLFTIKNKKFLLAHLNVFLNGEGEVQRDLDQIKEIALRLIDNQMLDAGLAVDMVTIKSLTEIKQKIKSSMLDKQESNESQMQQQLEQFQQQLAEANKALEALQKQDLNAKAQEFQLKAKQHDDTMSHKNNELIQKDGVDQEKLKNDSKRIDLEALQLADDNGNSKEIRNY